MALHGCLRCLKYIVFTLNFIVWILGMILVGLSLYMRLDTHTDHLVRATFTTSRDPNDINLFHMLCYILLATGTIMTCAGFLGCGGAYQESRCMLAMFSILLFTIICGEVASLTWTYINKNKVNYGRLFKMNIQHRYNMDRDDLSNSIDYVQSKLKCCGATGAYDWKIAKYQRNYDSYEEIDIAPMSCCTGYDYNLEMASLKSQSTCKIIATSTIYKGGCRRQLVNLFKEYIFILLSVQFFVAMIQLFSLMLSFGLCCAMRGHRSPRKA